MSVKKYAVCIAAGALAAAVIVGCSQQQDPWLTVAPGQTEADAALYRDVLFDDIPIPPEFELINNRSFSFQGATFRNGVYHYQGKVEWTWTLEYLRTELPNYGWVLERTDRGYDYRTLVFNKGQERLFATARQIRGGTGLELQLENAGRNDLLLRGQLPRAGQILPN